jgi:hypothetical protein
VKNGWALVPSPSIFSDREALDMDGSGLSRNQQRSHGPDGDLVISDQYGQSHADCGREAVTVVI